MKHWSPSKQAVSVFDLYGAHFKHVSLQLWGVLYLTLLWMKTVSWCEGENEWTAMKACYYEGPKSKSSPCNPRSKVQPQRQLGGFSWNSWSEWRQPSYPLLPCDHVEMLFFSQFSITTHPCRVLGGKTVNCALGRKGPVEISSNGERNSAAPPCTLVSQIKTHKSHAVSAECHINTWQNTCRDRKYSRPILRLLKGRWKNPPQHRSFSLCNNFE